MKGTSSASFIPGMVSVIVASYNHEEYLKQRMDSLINQTYENIEILVIDDCSSDNSVEVLEPYKKNPKVKLVINNKNSGWVNVSNKGISLSRGEYIIFANCDDYSELEQIEKLAEQFKSNSGISMCFSKSNMVNKDNILLGNDYDIRDKEFKEFCNSSILIPRKLMISFLMHSCIIPNLSGVLIRKQDFLKAGGFSTDYKVVSDWDLFFKLCQYGDTFWVFEPLNNFRQHNETIRAVTKDKVVYTEIFSLLYSQFSIWDFTSFEKNKFIGYISSIWANYLIKSPISGINNFRYHLKLSKSFNKKALWFIIPKLFVVPVNIIVSKIKRISIKKKQ